MEKPANLVAYGGVPRPQITLLNPAALDQVCVRGHLPPSEDLAAFVAVAWTLKWKLPEGQTFTQKVLPNPCVQFVADASGRAEIVGIVTGAFPTTIQGEGFIFGLRFRPCGFRAVARQPAAQFTNRRVPVTDLAPDLDLERIQQLAGTADTGGLLALVEDALRRLEPRRDEVAASLEELIHRMEQDSQMMSVDQAAQSFGSSSRTLQRLFRDYVGISPKWLLRRFRLKEAAARIESGEHDNLAGLAQRLGYYDQAHLNRDFRALIGETPGAWGKERSGCFGR